MVDSAAHEIEAGVFAHGFLGSLRSLRSRYAKEWRRHQIGSVRLAVHPRLAVAKQSRGDLSAALLGQAVDIGRNTADSNRILLRLTQRIRKAGLTGGVGYAAELGGRWAIVIAHGRTVHVLNDSHAAQSVYWHQVGDQVVFASHAALCADESGAQPDEETLHAFSKVREVRPKGTVFLPGVRTPYEGVRPLIANCRIEVADDKVRHLRYGPLEPRVEVGSGSKRAYAEFERQFERHLKLLTSFGPVGLSLTAGGDSAVTLAALSRIRPPGAFSFTYVNPREVAGSEGVAQDLFGASERAFKAQIPHRVLRWRRPPEDDPFEAVVSKTWPLLRPSIGAAFAMYRDLPRDFFELQSTISETGTTFYRSRTDLKITAERLTALWAGPQAARCQEYIEAFEEYIEYCQFTTAAMNGYDYHDVFYWEHRNSRWAAEKYQVGDIGHRVLLPFNARPIIEAMLSLPYRDRARKWILKEHLSRRGSAYLSA